MTTKKFQVRTNLKGLEDATFTCDTRKEAIDYITNALEGNSQLNPQDLILEEIEVKSKTEQLVDELMETLERYDDEWKVEQEKNRAFISRPCGLWTFAVLQDIVEFIEQDKCADHSSYINSDGKLCIYNEINTNY